MLSRKKSRKTKNNRLIGVACGVIICAAAASSGYYVFFSGYRSLVGQWERIEISATEEQVERLNAADRVVLTDRLNQRQDSEGMNKQFLEDGTGLRVINSHGVVNRHTFEWTAHDGILRTIEGGFAQVNKEYSLSGFRHSRLSVTTFNGEGLRWETWEFRRVN